MIKASVEELARDYDHLLEAAQTESVIVTRGGAPVAIISGIEFKDAEDVAWENDAEFWREIARRRTAGGGIPLEAMESELFPEGQAL